MLLNSVLGSEILGHPGQTIVIANECPVQEGSEILISEEDVVARAAETEATKRADAALLERCMDQQLKART